MKVLSTAVSIFSSVSLLLFLLFPSRSAANEGNILVTGDVLPTNGQLFVPNAVLVIQDDCNLVLYNKGVGFQSNTHGRGTNCTLTVSDYGQLIIKSGNGTLIWSSIALKVEKGEYAAILQPDGQVGIYGPAWWSISGHKNTIMNSITDKSENAPTATNLLFSSEILNENSKLKSRDYAFGLNRCNLELTKAAAGVIWGTSVKPQGLNCFARLNHHGQLSLVGDNYKVLWESEPSPMKGIYVLVMKITGQATIYRRVIWSAPA